MLPTSKPNSTHFQNTSHPTPTTEHLTMQHNTSPSNSLNNIKRQFKLLTSNIANASFYYSQPNHYTSLSSTNSHFQHRHETQYMQFNKRSKRQHNHSTNLRIHTSPHHRNRRQAYNSSNGAKRQTGKLNTLKRRRNQRPLYDTKPSRRERCQRVTNHISFPSQQRSTGRQH